MIDFIGLYRMTAIEPTLRAFGFEGLDQAEAALGQLARAGLLVEHRGREAIGGTLAYWTLAKKGAELANVSTERARPLREQAIWHHLATLWFCTMGQGRRYRLEAEEVGELFGEAPHVNSIFAADETAVYRLYVTSSKPDATIKQLSKHINDAKKRPGLRAAVARGELRFAALVETEEQEQKLRKKLSLEGIPARVIVERAPGPSTTPRG